MRISIFTKRQVRGGRSTVRFCPRIDGLEKKVSLSTVSLSAAPGTLSNIVKKVSATQDTEVQNLK